jgi:hypothetical protein
MPNEVEPRAPPRVAPPRRARCPTCGAFVRQIDRTSPCHKASTRRIRTATERSARRERIAIKNQTYRDQKHDDTQD